jgi:hypothetical protein
MVPTPSTVYKVKELYQKEPQTPSGHLEGHQTTDNPYLTGNIF